MQILLNKYSYKGLKFGMKYPILIHHLILNGKLGQKILNLLI